MEQDQTLLAGERTQPPPTDNEHVSHGCEQFGQSDLQSENLGSERGGMLYNGRTAKEWFGLHEVIRQDYARAIGELEAQDREIKKHEALGRDRLSKLHPHGVQQ